MVRRFVRCLGALALAVAAACQAPVATAAPSMIGHTLSFLRAYPTVDTQFGSAIPGTTVVAGDSDAVSWFAIGRLFAVIDPEADYIRFSTRETIYAGAAPTFDGFVVSGFDADIESVSVMSNNTNFDLQLAHDLRSFTLNLNGASPRGDGLIDIGVRLRDAVPPTGLALPSTSLFLAAALGLLCLRMRPPLRSNPGR